MSESRFINNKPCLIWKENDSLHWIGEQGEKHINNYFCLDIDYNKIYKELINADKDIEALIDKYFGLM